MYMPSTFPFSTSQNADRLLALLGSFWSSTFTNAQQVRSLTHAVAQRDVQHYLDILDLVASVSRFKVPVFHVENWRLLTLRESERNRTPADFPRYGVGGLTYGESSGLSYGDASPGDLYRWPLPAGGLVGARTILNRITQSSVVLTGGVDFAVADGAISFRDDPFDNADVLVQDVLSGGAVVDREALLWVWRGEYDWETVYRQFGYAVGLRAASSAGYKELVNAVFDGLVEGTSVRAVQQVWSSLCDVPLVKEEEETVEQLVDTADAACVVTDRHVYKFHPDAQLTVAVGDVLRAGATMSDTLRFYEFNRGQLPDELTALALGRGLLAAGYFGDLVFENRSVPLVVNEDVDGYTRVSFELGGLATDVDKFWDDVHAAGVAAGQTLAMLMDQRAEDSRDTQPTALALPANVNPLGFLLGNVLRNNAYAVVVRPTTFGPNALDVARQVILRKLIPPHTVGIVVVELDGLADGVIMSAGGTETDAGYSETVVLTPTLTAPDAVNGTTDISERVWLRQLRGKCE